MAYINISQYCPGHVNTTNIAIVMNKQKFDIGLHFVKKTVLFISGTLS